MDWIKSLISSLFEAQAFKDFVMGHTATFCVWTIAAFTAGDFVGKRLIGIPTFYDLTKAQRKVLADARKGGRELLEVDADVLGLVNLGLISEEHGYDVDASSVPHRFMLTVKGNRMLNFHPMTRRLAARAKGGT